MAPSLRLTVPGKAEPKGSARAFLPKGSRRPIVTSDNPALKDWERQVRAALLPALAGLSHADKAALFDGPVLVALDFHLPRPGSLPRRVRHHLKRPDLDKLTRGSIDALSGVAIRDDAHVVELRARKVYAASSALVHIRVERLGE